MKCTTSPRAPGKLAEGIKTSGSSNPFEKLRCREVMCRSNGLQVLPTNSVRSPLLPENCSNLFVANHIGRSAHDAKQVPQWRRRPAFVVRDRLRAADDTRQPHICHVGAPRSNDSARRTRARPGSRGPVRATHWGLCIDAGGPSRWLECPGGRPRPHLGIGRVPPLARQRLQRTATRDHGTGPVPGWGPGQSGDSGHLRRLEHR